MKRRVMLFALLMASPATHFIDMQGNIIAQRQGPAEWDLPESIAFFKDLIYPKETTP